VSGTLIEELREAEARVLQLQRHIGAATCIEVGEHDWKHIGGCNAGCDEECGCSVPVHECTRCGDCDYGDNEEAASTRASCLEERQ
jgi:hypothetical protein